METAQSWPTDLPTRVLVAGSQKPRHDIADGRIRALYGHSIPGTIHKTRAVPPERLFHGTAPASWAEIHVHGLVPMRRQYVHMSTNVETALAVGLRRSSTPRILLIDAARVHADGTPFYEGHERVWLAFEVPCEYIAPMDDTVGSPANSN
jgi:putative RNA 2'-phosphotransferase